jgi:hypothetical protein
MLKYGKILTNYLCIQHISLMNVLPVNVDVDKQVLEVIDGQAVEVRVGFVHLNCVKVFVS